MAQAYVKQGPFADRALPALTGAVSNAFDTGIFLASAPLVTTLPTTPVDGQECNLLVDATNGIVWHLVYRAAEAGPYKWYFTGGEPLFGEDASSMTPGAGNNLTTNTTPAVTVPNAGDYLVEHGAQVGNLGGAADATVCYLRRMSDNLDYVAQLQFNSPAGASASYAASVARGRRINGVTAGSTFVQRCTNVNGVASVQMRWLLARPYRIG